MSNAILSGARLNNERIKEILAIFLVFQIGLFFFLINQSGKSSQSAGGPTNHLLSLDFDKLKKISISERSPDEKKISNLTLNKEGGFWWLADKVLAKISTVNNFINNLQEVREGIPVTSSGETPERYKVGQNNFVRKIDLVDAKGQQVTILVGEAAGLRNVYVRLANDKNVYSVELNRELTTANDREWLDRDCLKFTRSQFNCLSLNDFQIKLGNSGWVLSSNGKDTQISATTAVYFIDQISKIRVDSILARTAAEAEQIKSESPDLKLEVKLKNGQKNDFVFSGVKGKPYHALKTTGRACTFAVSNEYVDSIKAIDAKQILEANAAVEGIAGKSTAKVAKDKSTANAAKDKSTANAATDKNSGKH